MTLHAARVLAQDATSHDLPMPAWGFALLALAVFALLLAFTWAFRGNAQKHTPDSEHNDHHSTDLAHAHGGTMLDHQGER